MSPSAREPDKINNLAGAGEDRVAVRKPFWGKYRGTVLNNIDPEALGRLLCQVSAVPGMLTNWAMPCVPYAGAGVGFYAIPPIGAAVWVEFEGGDPNHPIWTGCFWREGEVPIGDIPPNPLVKVLRTESALVTLSDIPGGGGVTLSFDDPGLETPMTIQMNVTGVSMAAGNAQVAFNTFTGVTISFGPATFSMSDVISQFGIGESQLVLTPSVAALNGTEVGIAADSDVFVQGTSVELRGSTSVNGTKLG